MRVGFSLFRYFPYGGRERQCLKIARACQGLGLDVRLYVHAWEGDPPTDLTVVRLAARGHTNHRRLLDFGARVRERAAADTCQILVGFCLMAGLDIYYASDLCFQYYRRHRRLYRLTPRYRAMVGLEETVFGAASSTRILTLAEGLIAPFQACYATPRERFAVLPPGIDLDRRAADDDGTYRTQIRSALGLAIEERLILLLGSDFRRKGLDRALRALAALPDIAGRRCRLWAVGTPNPAPFQRLARRLDIAERVHFPGPRDDVPDLLAAADLLIHPAYLEAAGGVIVEALVAGLPVLTTANCGYANHVVQAGGGIVLVEPFCQAALDTALATMLDSPEWETWRRNGIAYGRRPELYRRPEAAAQLITAWMARR